MAGLFRSGDLSCTSARGSVAGFGQGKIGRRCKKWLLVVFDLLGRFFLGLLFGVVGGEFAFELLNPSAGVNKFLAASVNGVASVADVHPNFRPGTAGGESVPTTASHLRDEVFGMNVFLHSELLVAVVCAPWVVRLFGCTA